MTGAGRRRTGGFFLSLGYPLFLLLGGILPSGCATQADVQKLQRDLYRVNRETRTSLESIRRDVETLAGRVARLRHERGQGRGGAGVDSGVSYERIVRLEDRVAKLELELEAGRARVAPPPQTETPAPGAEPPKRELNVCAAYAADASAPEEMQRAGRATGEGNYEMAISEYRGLLRRSPASPLADDAQFCIGEAYFELGDYSTAIYEYDNVRVKYPSSDKIPGALLKSGYGFVKLGNRRDARLFFQKVVRDYGSSQEAIRARQELESLGSE